MNQSIHNRQRWAKRIFNIAIVVVAYGYLIYKLSTFDDYTTLAHSLSTATPWQWWCLILAIALFPLNIFFDAWKWQYLLRKVEPMTLSEAQRQTYFGFVGAFLTPGRLGDYPTRVTLLKDKKNAITAIALGFVGTFALSSLQIIAGMPAAMHTLSSDTFSLPWYAYLISLFFIGGFVFSPMIARQLRKREIKKESLRITVDALADFHLPQLLVVFAMSALRYVVYCAQMWLVMIFCGISLSPVDMMLAICTYYLLVTVTPSVPVADAAVRGSWAIVVFSKYTTNEPAIALSAIIVWILNTILPMIVGTMVKKNNHSTPQSPDSATPQPSTPQPVTSQPS